jgi:hypothetical protein
VGIHLFNPPEAFANPHKGCGTCTGVPKRWKLTIPEYSIATPEGAPEPGPVILRRTRARDSSGLIRCRWVPQNSQEETAGDFDWFLEYRPSFATAPGPSPIVSQQTYWHIWIPGEDVVGGTLREVDYITFPAESQLTPDDLYETHFACLGQNKFWYNNSDTNPGGGRDLAELDGWPLTLTIEPYYGEIE